MGHVKWRPQRKYHLASCALVVDCSINVWDVRRPYIPFASFDEHKDVATGVAWKGDPHCFLSTSRVSLIAFFIKIFVRFGVKCWIKFPISSTKFLLAHFRTIHCIDICFRMQVDRQVVLIFKECHQITEAILRMHVKRVVLQL